MQLILNRTTNFSLWELYVDSFPPQERRSVDKHKEILLDPRFMPFDIYDEMNELVGLFYCWDCGEFIYGEHFAVFPKARNNGIGKQTIDTIKKIAGNKTIIIEVEPPVDDLTNRRVGFYKREGFHVTAHEYMHPSYSNLEPYLLNIMSYPKDLSKDEFETFRDFAFSVL